ncbi:MAG: hypothetical protein H0T12_08135 [Actinobacteria bacterium]|nr:hypothetical protein [Actinomycetota bacterium]
MRLEIRNGDWFGTAEWCGPGEVALDIPDPGRREWFQRYFQSEDAFLTGAVDGAEMSAERRDSSLEAFVRSAYQLARYSYDVSREIEGARGHARAS